MAFPSEGWPPRRPSGLRSLRFFAEGTGTTLFSDNAFLFIDGAGANPFTPTPVVRAGSSTVVAIGDPAVNPDMPGSPMGGGRAAVDANYSQPDVTGAQAQPKAAIWSNSIRIVNNGASTIEYSFDGTNVHGRLKAGEAVIYRHRVEAGISIRGNGMAFWIEAW